MPTLYVASTGAFSGKSAVCMGLLKRAERDGLSFSYMKPVSVSAVRTTQTVLDEDAALIRTMFQLDTPLEQMVPVPITSTLIDTVLQGEKRSFEQNLRTAYEGISRDRQFVVLEGSNTWAEGALVDLTADKVIEMLGAPCLLVARYTSLHSLDAVLTVKRYIGDNMLGVLINQVDAPQVDFVHNQIVPFLESRQIPVLGVLPQDRLLASVRVNDLVEHLGGHMIGQPEWCDRMVESLMIGSMGSAEALSFLRRRPNKAVILGGDRVDFQLVALDTSTNLLILTGNIQPSPRVIDRAEERRVPILVVSDDTLTTVERAEQLFGRVRFHEPAKLQRFTSLMDEHFDFERMYKALGVQR